MGIPTLTQYASPELIGEILYGDRERTEDPEWRTTGCPTLEEYAPWSVRWCGMACLRMVLLARDGQAPSLYDLAKGAESYGAYRSEPDQPEGLIYRPFVSYVRERFDLDAEVDTDLSIDRLQQVLASGRLVIASVHPEIRRPNNAAPSHRGGHLVLVTADVDGHVSFHDPSGHTPAALTPTMPWSVFEQYSAQRGISLRL
ncbi:C39 family peptidase [Euzebya tangerina]|uniref:C39 family peptidase n=1 Tax=Euzebya tangerina TaxID=591198 RepID=UPI0023E84ADB|nr:C39 family peptidase [Euzebya tangerina]